MGGFFGVTSKNDCVLDIFFGVDYHSHLGTKKGGMALHSKEKGFQREIHNIENTPFRTKFEDDLYEFEGCVSGIGCISDTDPQPIMVRSKPSVRLTMQRSCCRRNLIKGISLCPVPQAT